MYKKLFIIMEYSKSIFTEDNNNIKKNNRCENNNPNKYYKATFG